MSGLQATVIDGGMVDSPEKAARTAEVLKSEDIEILFIFISTYALSSTILPIAQRIKIPVILLNIQPVAAINYDYINGLGDRGKMTGEWLAHCQACSTPEFACVFNRAGIKYDILTGYLEEPYVWNEIENWIDAVNGPYKGCVTTGWVFSDTIIAVCWTFTPTLPGNPSLSALT